MSHLTPGYMFSNPIQSSGVVILGRQVNLHVPPTSAFLSKIVRSIPGTFTGRRIPAVMPDKPAPMIAT